jgi:prevent-host-death family protein
MKTPQPGTDASWHLGLREAGAVYTVREAKAGLSAILRQLADGSEVTITSRGRPVARIVPPVSAGTGFVVDRDWLRSMRVRGTGPRAEQIIREDRDGRG